MSGPVVLPIPAPHIEAVISVTRPGAKKAEPRKAVLKPVPKASP